MAVLGFTLVALAAVLVPQAAGVVARRSLTPTPTAMPPPIPLGHVAEVSGQVESRSPGAAYVLLYRGATLLPADGTLIRTTGSHAYAKLSLADGSTLFVGPDALVELRAVTGSQSARDIQVVLESGRLLVAADPTRRSGFIVRTRTGAYALALGSLMGAEFDREAQALDVDCFQGACEIGGESLRQALRLSGGQHARADAAGIARGSVGTRNERFSFGDFGGGLIPTPTHIPTPTPTTTPTNTPTDTPTRKPTSAAALTPTDAPSPPPSETPTQPPPPPPADTLAGPTLAPPPEETTPTLAPPPP